MAGEVRFKIQGKTYDTATVDEISLRDVVLFNSQAADVGLGVTWADIERISNEIAELGDTEVAHPDALVMFAVTIWAARRVAGDDVTLDQALSVPMKDIEIVEARKAPKDHAKKKSGRSIQPASVPEIGEASTSPVSDETTPAILPSKSASA